MNKKIFYLHIPKTAGSTINRIFGNDKNEFHCERYFYESLESGYNEDFNQIKTYDFVSGHIKIKDFIDKMDYEKYFIFTFMRNPLDQFSSHYNWLERIQHFGEEFFYNHPKRIQNLSIMVAKSKLDNIEYIIEILKEHEGLFANNQSKHLIGDYNIEEALEKYNYIGLTENLKEDLNKIFNVFNRNIEKEFLNNICKLQINKNEKYLIDFNELKNNKKFMDFYKDYNSIDEKIYNMIKSQRS